MSSTLQEEIYRTIGKNVRKYRLAANISQEKLSEILNVNSKFIGHVERFERFISLKKLIEIAQYFDIPIKNFFIE
jgi:transcriptional regulator with XRE-family HTH domain